MIDSVCWDSQGVIMVDCLEKGPALNDAYYAQGLRQLHQEIVKKWKADLRCCALAR